MPLQPGTGPTRHDAGPANLVRPELGPMGAIGSVFAMVDAFAVTCPSFDDVDLRQGVIEFQVPVHLVQGPTSTRSRCGLIQPPQADTNVEIGH